MATMAWFAYLNEILLLRLLQWSQNSHFSFLILFSSFLPIIFEHWNNIHSGFLEYASFFSCPFFNWNFHFIWFILFFIPLHCNSIVQNQAKCKMYNFWVFGFPCINIKFLCLQILTMLSFVYWLYFSFLYINNNSWTTKEKRFHWFDYML